MKGFKHLGVWLMSEGRTQWQTERWIRILSQQRENWTGRVTLTVLPVSLVFRFPPMRFISLADTVSRATAAPRAGKPAEVAWTGQDASWAPSWRRCSRHGRAAGGGLEELWTHWRDSVSWLKKMVKVAKERAVRASLLRTLPPMPRAWLADDNEYKCEM